jgi:hypothetical protein
MSSRPPDPASAVPPNEKLLVACMLASSDARAVIRHYFSDSRFLEMLELKPVVEAILSAEAEGRPFSLSTCSESLEERFRKLLEAISFSESAVSEEQAAEQALDCLKLIEAKFLQARRESLKRRIRQLESEGNLNEAFRLISELDALGPATRVAESL